jgi:hypothetical protein
VAAGQAVSGRRATDTAAALRGALATPPAYVLPRSPTPGPPPADGSRPRRSKYTVLLDDWAALAFDQLQLQLRRRCGRRVDKSEIIRALVSLAEDDPALVDQVAERIGRPPR